MILAITEQQDGRLKGVSWETIAGAQHLAATTGGSPVAVAVVGARSGTRRARRRRPQSTAW